MLAQFICIFILKVFSKRILKRTHLFLCCATCQRAGHFFLEKTWGKISHEGFLTSKPPTLGWHASQVDGVIKDLRKKWSEKKEMNGVGSPANKGDMSWWKKILHQLRLVNIPQFAGVSYKSGGAGFLPSKKQVDGQDISPLERMNFGFLRVDWYIRTRFWAL